MISVQYIDLLNGVMTAGSAAKDGGNPMNRMFLMFAIIAFSFYFIILRPQKKERKERKGQMDSLKKGDKVVTIGGLYGSIVDLEKEGDTVTLEVDKNVRVKLLRSAISSVIKKS
jgi:preprotein translocase subunit YajC